MAVTIQQIAQRAGVSRGTVDRALNHRGRINPEVAERICSIAEEMGYTPGKRKPRGKKAAGLKLGIVTQLARTSFMLEINRGIHQAKTELEALEVEVLIREGISVNEEEQLKAIEELAGEGIQGLALMPADSSRIRERLNLLIEKENIPVVTFNSDIVGTRRSCFVGMDNRKSGQTAAGLMGMLTQGRGKILVITGFFSNNVNSARVDGFVEELKNSYPGLELAGVYGSFDEAAEVEKIIVNAMLNVAGITGIFVVSGGQEGIRRAFHRLNLERHPHTIIYDLTPENRKALQEGTADFLIDQNGYVQGYEPLFLLSDILLKKKYPERECHYTDINIKMKYNL